MKKTRKKKKSLFFKIFSFLLSILMLAAFGGLVFQIVVMDVLPKTLLLPICVAMGLFVLIFLFLLNVYTRKALGRFFISVIVIALVVVAGFGNYYVYKTTNMIENVTTHIGKVKNTVSVIAKADSSITDLKDLHSSNKVAALKNIDTFGTKKSFNDICKEFDVDTKKELPFKVKNVGSVQEACHSLYEGKVDAIILNESYRANVREMEQFANFDSETKVIYQTVFYSEESNSALAVSDITQEPFNVLVSGNDTYGDVDELSRSDVNMIVTVNPLTSTILLTSVPRDTYMPTYCDVTETCVNGSMDKITHTGIYGINTTQRTMENFLDIDVNYTFRANFSSVIDIVDALDGIDIKVDKGMAVPQFYADNTIPGVKVGKNHLNGERALAFARERHAYVDGDNQRVRNQQIVLKAIFKKATSKKVLPNYPVLLDALSGAFETNLTSAEITDLIKFQLQAMPDWKFEAYQVTGAGDMKMCASLGQEASVIVPYDGSAQIAHDKIMAVMNGESSDTVEDTLNATETEGALSEEEIRAQITGEIYGGYSTGSSASSNNVYYPQYTPTPDVPVDTPVEETPVVPDVPTDIINPQPGGDFVVGGE